MKTNRKLLRVGTPIRLDKLRTMLIAVDNDGDAIVSHYNQELIVERPDPQLGDIKT